MLFDLRSGKRRRVIQVVYATLAALFLIGFVGFGIGGEIGSGGIFDALGIGGDGGSTSAQYEDQIEEAEATLEQDPEDVPALLDLARYRYLSGQEQLGFDEERGATVVTEEARQELEASVAAWDRYLQTKPQHPNTDAAGQMVQVFILLGDPRGAADAQRIVAEEDGDSQSYYDLAYYLYADLEFDAADEAADRALAEAEPSERRQLERRLADLEEQARRFQRQLERESEQGAAGETPLENPFGPLGGGQ
jgi:tetratricopeptide (TPR) repeat protein